ncbi:hypothetical protein DCW30_04085 [Streptomyces alfalfae]|uniref:DUF3558 domain-containing protein n=1 Tax=Streptomyces alfalfae TaxID=1642299 RepID=A0ABM6H312_9ACTN|nr:hypothetical protein [Streptomyces alfalfae]AYA20855.1 hypothetical protein D3X13_00240 [Streptomyces fradiae]APY90470.1 hypothetical protein A7J05_00215 [Streptomyces alfalfae]APY91406.1 hypothetical protein A7J05_36520 [Streptomyces alfalfae]QUI29487.1 hypothetical protein H9W91_00200 [Streptomyces alfalfae]RXX46960.1 hypothetical protein DCW30_04085 [Streptomyces alfalfae]
MSRVRVALVTVLAGAAALTACSSSSSDEPDPASGGDKPVSSPAPKPITKNLSQAHLTQALLGDGETLHGYTVHDSKSTTEGQYCNERDDDSIPKGWVRGSDVDYEYNGSTLNMASLYICLFDTAEDAHSAYTAWKGHETNKQQKPEQPVGDENTLVINPGASEDSVDGYVRSGRVNIRVQIDGATGGDPSGAQTMLSATLKRLQQLQEGKPATVTAADEQAGARQ